MGNPVLVWMKPMRKHYFDKRNRLNFLTKQNFITHITSICCQDFLNWKRNTLYIYFNKTFIFNRIPLKTVFNATIVNAMPIKWPLAIVVNWLTAITKMFKNHNSFSCSKADPTVARLPAIIITITIIIILIYAAFSLYH